MLGEHSIGPGEKGLCGEGLLPRTCKELRPVAHSHVREPSGTPSSVKPSDDCNPTSSETEVEAELSHSLFPKNRMTSYIFVNL